jgi:pimeloyl-ACP methyl ester carboxylesterase
LDVQRAYELHLSNDAAVEFLGGTPKEVPEHFREASPIEISIPKVHQLIVHGTQDEVVPVEISRNYELAKKKRGEDLTLMEIAGAGHFELIDPESKAWTQIAQAIRKMVA